MSINTQYPAYLAIGTLPDTVIFGTAQVGDDFGTVKSATLDRTGDTEEILNGAGGLRMLLINNPRSEFSLDTLFTTDVTAPGLGERIAFPLLADDLGNPVCGSILKVTVKWEEKGARMLSISATNWDSLGARPQARSYDPATETWSDVTDTVALPSVIS